MKKKARNEGNINHHNAQKVGKEGASENISQLETKENHPIPNVNNLLPKSSGTIKQKDYREVLCNVVIGRSFGHLKDSEHGMTILKEKDDMSVSSDSPSYIQLNK